MSILVHKTTYDRDIQGHVTSSQSRTLRHVSPLESGGASTARLQSYVSCTGYQSADEWNSSYISTLVYRSLAGTTPAY